MLLARIHGYAVCSKLFCLHYVAKIIYVSHDANDIQKYSHSFLTHCILVHSSTVICWLSPFVILGVSDLFCHFYSIFDEKLCYQTMKTLIRCHMMWHLICVCMFAYDPFMGGLKHCLR